MWKFFSIVTLRTYALSHVLIMHRRILRPFTQTSILLHCAARVHAVCGSAASFCSLLGVANLVRMYTAYMQSLLTWLVKQNYGARLFLFE